MHLRFLAANRAWIFLFGHDVRTVTIQDMGGFGSFFETRKEAIDAADACGLGVDKKGNVTVKRRSNGFN